MISLVFLLIFITDQVVFREGVSSVSVTARSEVLLDEDEECVDDVEAEIQILHN